MKFFITFICLIVIISCAKKSNSKFYHHNWVYENNNENRVVEFNMINDSIYYFQSAIFSKSYNIDSSTDAMQNFFSGVINIKDNRLISSCYDMSNNFSLNSKGDNLVLKFNKDFENNQYFPNEKNIFKIQYPVNIEFKKVSENLEETIASNFKSINDNFYFENKNTETIGRLNNKYGQLTIDLFKYPYHSSSLKMNINSSHLIKYCLINANFEKGQNDQFYDSTTYYKIYIFNGETEKSNNKYNLDGWIKKSDVIGKVDFKQENE